MNNKLISIITPCYNGEDYVIPHIEGILSQTYDNLEYIFVSDGSTDKTEEIILSYQEKFKEKNIKFYYIKQENKGQAAAINQGFKILKGEYFSCIDADDILMPDFVSKMSNFLNSNLQFSICFPNAEVVKDKSYEHIRFQKRILPPKTIDNFFDDMLTGQRTPVFASYMARSSDIFEVYKDRKIYEGLSGQNPQIILPLVYNKGAGYVNEVLIKVVIREKSDSNNLSNSEKFYKFINYEDLYCRILRYIPDMPEYEKAYYFYKIKTFWQNQRNNLLSISAPVSKDYISVSEDYKLSLPEMIFSVKNQYKKNAKYKVITILGIKIKLKQKSHSVGGG